MIDTAIQLCLLALVIVWCLLILYPFFRIMLWSFVLAMVLLPLHQTLSKKFENRSKWAFILSVILIITIVMLPAWLLIETLIQDVRNLIQLYKTGELVLPAPAQKVKEWPLVGDRIYSAWLAASENLKGFIQNHREDIAAIGKTLVNGILGVGGSALQLLISLIIACFLVLSVNVIDAGKRFFTKVIGEKGSDYADLIRATVNSVVKGVLGVAIIQTLIIGIGLVLAGVPHAGLWTLLVLILSILQIPPTLVVIPVAIYLFSEMEWLSAMLWTVYLFLGGISDNVLKPIILGKGASVPTLVIFLGVIGGFILSGFIGLFTGAIVLSIGYKLFIAWMNE